MSNRFFEIKEKLLSSTVRHFPRFITPNLITIMRIFFLPVIIYYILHGRLFVAMIFFIIVFLLDVLDGPLARSRGLVTNFGALADPFIDKIIFITVLLLVTWNSLPHSVIYTILALEIMMMLVAAVLAPVAKKLNFKFKVGANKWGKYKMVLQFAGIVLIMAAPENRIVIEIATVFFCLAIIYSARSLVTHCKSIQQ
ncbi:MAG: CDP-alcohol phosphatidyltransferase family protein [Patescibacteria group bacterium]|nr:CDP-alcohol phosphatidyltransferase family protein [Patescibacteria group bacterium]